MEWFIISILLLMNIITITIAKTEEKEKRDLQDKIMSLLERELMNYNSKRNV